MKVYVAYFRYTHTDYLVTERKDKADWWLQMKITVELTHFPNSKQEDYDYGIIKGRRLK